MSVTDRSSRPRILSKHHLSLVGSRYYVAVVDLGGFEAWLRSWSAAERTIGDRVIVIRAGLREWGDPRQTTPEVLTRWLSNPALAPWTRVKYFYDARSYFGWLHQTGQIEVNPAAELRTPKSPQDRPRPLTADEVTLVLPAASGNLHSYLLLGLLAGLRVHEVAKFRGEDIDVDAIFVLGKGRQQAFIPTHPDLWALAQKYPRRGWLFPSPRGEHLTPHHLGKIVSRYLPDGLTTHTLRHRCGTVSYAATKDLRAVQELLGHAKPETTMLYTLVPDAAIREAMLAAAA